MQIIKGLFNPTYGYVRAAIAIVAGVLLIIYPDVAVNTVIMIIGGLLIIIGGVSIALSFKDKNSHVNIMGFNGFFDLLFGLVLLLFPSFFATLLIYVFGFIMLVFGIGEIANLASARRTLKFGIMYFILPFAIAACGVVMLFKPFESMTTLFMIFGVSLLVYGVSEFISTIKLRKVIKMQQAYEYRVEDSSYEEVKGEKHKADSDGEGEDDSPK